MREREGDTRSEREGGREIHVVREREGDTRSEREGGRYT